MTNESTKIIKVKQSIAIKVNGLVVRWWYHFRIIHSRFISVELGNRSKRAIWPSRTDWKQKPETKNRPIFILVSLHLVKVIKWSIQNFFCFGRHSLSLTTPCEDISWKNNFNHRTFPSRSFDTPHFCSISCINNWILHNFRFFHKSRISAYSNQYRINAKFNLEWSQPVIWSYQVVNLIWNTLYTLSFEI